MHGGFSWLRPLIAEQGNSFLLLFVIALYLSPYDPGNSNISYKQTIGKQECNKLSPFYDICSIHLAYWTEKRNCASLSRWYIHELILFPFIWMCFFSFHLFLCFFFFHLLVLVQLLKQEQREWATGKNRSSVNINGFSLFILSDDFLLFIRLDWSGSLKLIQLVLISSWYFYK